MDWVAVQSRVLLVEDVRDVRLLVRTALAAAGGFSLTEADTGATAVGLAGAERPDVIVLDLGLPDLAAEDVLVGLRMAAPGSKIVIYTGRERPQGGVFSDVQGYLSKDTPVEDLVRLLRSVTQPLTEDRASLELPKDVSSAAKARRFVADQLRAWRLPHLIDDAVVVISELTTNAVTHAASTCRLTLALTSSTVRIEVRDSGEQVPAPRVAAATDEGGRGLLIISALSAAWGLDVQPSGGKLVWAELPTGSPSA